MKKLMKKVFVVMTSIAVVLTLACLTSVKAAGEGTITINSGTSLNGKSFKVYQLMTATVTGEGENVKVSYTINPKYLEALKTATGKTNDTEILNYLEDENLTSEKVRLFADAMRESLKNEEGDKQILINEDVITYSFDVDYGYYLVVENDAATGATSLCMLNSATPTSTVNLKSDYPAVEKKVKEETYNNDDGYGNGYNDAADYDIGDDVPFAFYSKVPSMEGYETYKYVFHDKMSSGLDFNTDSVEITIGESRLIKNTDYSIVTEELDDGCTFHIEINDLTNYSKGADIRVDYTAKLNQDAVVGLLGNPNEVRLEYSSNPYDDNETNETPVDKVVVFTFRTEVDKVNEDGNKLAGAKFELYADGSCTEQIKLTTKDGKYVVDSEGTAVITSDEKNNIVIEGLDSGTYYLKETKAPDGYDLLKDPIEITITATYIDRQNWVAGEDANQILNELEYAYEPSKYIDLDKSNILTGLVVVKNFTHGKLPETGGIGNYVFYATGLLLMAGAGYFYMKKEKKVTYNE